MVRGFSNLRNTDAGFITDKRLLFDVSFLGAKYQTAQSVQQAQLELVAAVKNVQGVIGAGLVSGYPMRGRLEGSLLTQFHGEPFNTVNPPGTRQRFATPVTVRGNGHEDCQGPQFRKFGYANTIPVAIVNKVFVERYFKGRDPIGVQFSAGYPAPNPKDAVTIIGVIDDVRQKSLAEAAEHAFYNSTTPFAFGRATAVVAMSQTDLAAVERGIREAVRKINPTMSIDFELASDVVAGTLKRQELGMTLMLVFGGIAVVLAAVGIYGVISYAGSLRRDEMATRLALGASPRSVFLLVMKQGALLGVAGAAIGVGLAYFSGQIISSRAYAIRASDPFILSAATPLIFPIKFLITTIPALRSARLNPAKALRSA
ncbi:MAG: FtsX-like permease family protein [Phycisphaerae bacterium]|nr:FtsX-like permease family protein [Gemmatimonadaceae bacterium]